MTTAFSKKLGIGAEKGAENEVRVADDHKITTLCAFSANQRLTYRLVE